MTASLDTPRGPWVPMAEQQPTHHIVSVVLGYLREGGYSPSSGEERLIDAAFNLDPDTAAHVFHELLGLISHTGVAALIATHNFDLARRMHRVLRLENGVLQEILPANVG